MTFTLQEIIQMGGPTGFALLFAWLWQNAVKKYEARVKLLEDKFDEERNARLEESVVNAKSVMTIANDLSRSLDLISAKIGGGHVK